MNRSKWIILGLFVAALATPSSQAALITGTFGLLDGEYQVRHVAARSRMLNTVGDARRLIRGDIARVGQPARGAYDVINFFDPENGYGGHFFGGTPFPGDGTGDDQAFAIRVRGWVEIPEPGVYTFGVNSDDGFRLRLGPVFMRHLGPRFTADTLQTATFDRAGRYRLKLTYFEQGNGAELELYAARGAFDTYEAGALPTGVALPPPEPGTDVPEPAATLVILFAVGIRLLGRVTRHPPSPALR
ncbi:MAG TPA: PA14 domain-containing protein [Longimicrobium sp.]|nr:PA14 domain-containing protein [Longimicrobium sp.]